MANSNNILDMMTSNTGVSQLYGITNPACNCNNQEQQGSGIGQDNQNRLNNQMPPSMNPVPASELEAQIQRNLTMPTQMTPTTAAPIMPDQAITSLPTMPIQTTATNPTMPDQTTANNMPNHHDHNDTTTAPITASINEGAAQMFPQLDQMISGNQEQQMLPQASRQPSIWEVPGRLPDSLQNELNPPKKTTSLESFLNNSFFTGAPTNPIVPADQGQFSSNLGKKYAIISMPRKAANEVNLQSMNGFLKTQTGEEVSIQFLIGTNALVEKTGTILAIGDDYLIMKEKDSNDILICDFNNIEFIRFENKL